MTHNIRTTCGIRNLLACLRLLIMTSWKALNEPGERGALTFKKIRHVLELKWRRSEGTDDHVLLVNSFQGSCYRPSSLCHLLWRGKPFCSDIIDLGRSNRFIHAIIWKEKFKVKTWGSTTVKNLRVDNQRSWDAFEPGGLPETVILSVQRSPSWQIETLYLPECLHNFQGKCSF